MKTMSIRQEKITGALNKVGATWANTHEKINGVYTIDTGVSIMAFATFDLVELWIAYKGHPDFYRYRFGEVVAKPWMLNDNAFGFATISQRAWYKRLVAKVQLAPVAELPLQQQEELQAAEKVEEQVVEGKQLENIIHVTKCGMFRVVKKSGEFYPQERVVTCCEYSDPRVETVAIEERLRARYGQMVHSSPFEGWFLGYTCRRESKGYKRYKSEKAAIKYVEQLSQELSGSLIEEPAAPVSEEPVAKHDAYLAERAVRIAQAKAACSEIIRSYRERMNDDESEIALVNKETAIALLQLVSAERFEYTTGKCSACGGRAHHYVEAEGYQFPICQGCQEAHKKADAELVVVEEEQKIKEYPMGWHEASMSPWEVKSFLDERVTLLNLFGVPLEALAPVQGQIPAQIRKQVAHEILTAILGADIDTSFLEDKDLTIEVNVGEHERRPNMSPLAWKILALFVRLTEQAYKGEYGRGYIAAWTLSENLVGDAAAIQTARVIHLPENEPEQALRELLDLGLVEEVPDLGERFRLVVKG